MPTPFVDKPFTFTQPDGSTIDLVGTGNQYRAEFRTLDGRPVVRDPATREFRYVQEAPASGYLLASAVMAANIAPAGAPPAPADPERKISHGLPLERPRWEVRRMQQRTQSLADMANFAASPAPPQRRTVGKYVGLCLLIEFPDEPATISREEVEAFCNQAGYGGFGNNGSVRDYFYSVSDRKLTYTNIVAPYYRAQFNRDHYTDPAAPFGQRARELIVEALNHHLAAGFDFTGLTSDSQNYVYAINVFYAGPCVNNWSEGLWPHSSFLQPGLQLAPGKIAHDYQITEMGDELTLGTFCHENGHMICDFPDLYEYDRNGNRGVGNFCLMCTGNHADQKNPVQVGAYLKNAAGWASQLYNIAANTSVSLKAGVNAFAIRRRNTTEYFIIENRRQAGRDASLPDAGLAIWRIDELGSNPHPSSRNYECTLIQADGLMQIENAQNSGDATDLYDNVPGIAFSKATTPNSKWRDGVASGLTIRKISAAGPTMTFQVGP